MAYTEAASKFDKFLVFDYMLKHKRVLFAFYISQKHIDMPDGWCNCLMDLTKPWAVTCFGCRTTCFLLVNLVNDYITIIYIVVSALDTQMQPHLSKPELCTCAVLSGLFATYFIVANYVAIIQDLFDLKLRHGLQSGCLVGCN